MKKQKEKKKKNKEQKPKIVYKEDTGETIYSMAGLYGDVAPRKDEEKEQPKSTPVRMTHRERAAMIRAAFQVYTPVLLCTIGAFALAALLLYFFFLRG